MALANPMSGDPSPSFPFGALVRAGVGFVAKAVSRIVKRIAGIAAPAIVLGCSGPKVEKVEEKPAAVEPAPLVETDDPKPLGRFHMTFYYVIGEEEVARAAVRKNAANDNEAGAAELASIAPAQGEMVTLYAAKGCTPIAEVTKEFAAQLRLQGTGKLRDGRVVNVWGPCSCESKNCYKVTRSKWGTAGTGRPLQPFRTVAVDRHFIKLGSLLYVPELEGRRMPGRAPWGGFIHDGCVVADDTGGGIVGKQLDLFVGRKAYFHSLSGPGASHAWARHVAVYDGSKICERKGRKVGRKVGGV